MNTLLERIQHAPESNAARLAEFKRSTKIHIFETFPRTATGLQ